MKRKLLLTSPVSLLYWINVLKTLSLGLHYEYYPLINRGNRGIQRWDPATNTVHMGGIGSVPFTNDITVSKKLFAPRVGFAYRMGDKTVVRAGYGITYDPLPFGRPMRGQDPGTMIHLLSQTRT